MSYPVVETFASINGESCRAGEPAFFIRFRGCNLYCAYCDTAWANTSDAPARMMTAEELTELADVSGITDVTLTGGEPLLQKELGELIALLMQHGHRVEIETNGSLPIAPLCNGDYRPVFTLDYKLPCSGMEQHMLTEENYSMLIPDDAVKFVSGSLGDLECAAQIIMKYRLTDRCQVFISPVFGAIDPKDIAAFLIEHKLNRVRLQLQLHKLIWSPDQRGV